MRPIFAFLLMLFNLPLAEAQINLVPNPSFEDTLNCDSFKFYQASLPWFTPTNCTPDYYHGVNPSCGNSAIQNPTGYQLPYDGIAYVGMFFAKPLNSSVGTREYITTELIDTLTAGKEYQLIFFVSRANMYYLATDDIGAYISQQAPSGSGCFHLPFIPQIENPQGNIITDSTNWTSISGLYTAIGGEKYLTIGNFKDSINTTIIDADNGIGDSPSAYYYIDKVSLIQLDSLQSLNNEIDNERVIFIYPSLCQSGSNIWVDLKLNISSRFIFYSLDGKILLNGLLYSGKNQIVTEKLSAGVYILSINTRKGIISSKIVIY